MVDFVEICNVYVGKMIIKAAKKIFNSDKICRSYGDLNFGVTFLEHSVLTVDAFDNGKTEVFEMNDLWLIAQQAKVDHQGVACE